MEDTSEFEIQSEDRNMLRGYQFCKENKKHLLEFLKTASENQSSSCDKEQYRLFQRMFPMDHTLKNELREYLHKPVEVIDITQSENGDEEIDISLELISNHEDMNTSSKANQSTVDDLTYAVKECLANQKFIENSVLNNLQSPSLDTEQVFKDLLQILNHKEVINLGTSIITSSITNELVVVYYIRYLLIKQMGYEISESLLNLVKDFSINYADVLSDELTAYLSNTGNNLKTSLQFIEKGSNDFKNKILRNIVFNNSDLKEHLISCLEVLLNPQSDYDTLNKLIELMSTSASNYSQDKNFGKLFTIIIKYLGKNVTSLEQPLRHIVNSHRSIWKTKMQKLLNDSIQDNLILTQSFRY
ncbi:unnamed protein product [Callosobruchus maculatus]|uniref:Fanconi Anaemia group E protein C-terminal domain-containing protein n=1 Tax=Callosobruchus maculatus TaxID=64391 RepID=A0A653BIV7_CALMS|nr:unnamed protein product [Callosobruchus maculatus]